MGADRIPRLLKQVPRCCEVTAPRRPHSECRARVDEQRGGGRRGRDRIARTLRTERHGFWCAGGAQRTIRKRRRPRSVGFPSRIAAF